MKPTKKTAIAVGVLFLAAMLTYITGDGLVASILDSPDVLGSVKDNPTKYAAGAILMLLNSVVVVAIGVMMFPVLSHHSKRIAAAYLGTRIVEGTVLATGIVSLLSLLTLGGLSGNGLATMAEVAIGNNFFAFQVAMLALGLGSVAFCWLLYRTALIPRGLALLGLVGYVALASGAALEIMGVQVGLMLSIPGGLFELALPVWLFARGFNSSTPQSSVMVGEMAR